MIYLIDANVLSEPTKPAPEPRVIEWLRQNERRLAILPDLTHYEIFFAPELARTVLPFLNGQTGTRSWAEED